jgi:hypothetical protein
MASTSAGSCSVATWLARFDTVFTRRVTERVSSKAINAASNTALSAINVRMSACFCVVSASVWARSTIEPVMSFWRSRLWSDSALNPSRSNWAPAPASAARRAASSWNRYFDSAVVKPPWRNCFAHSSGAIALNSFITDSISV